MTTNKEKAQKYALLAAQNLCDFDQFAVLDLPCYYENDYASPEQVAQFLESFFLQALEDK